MLPKEVDQRLLIEKFINRVTEALYMDRSDPMGLVSDRDRTVLTGFLAAEFKELQQKLYNADACESRALSSAYASLKHSLTKDGTVTIIYLKAANLHLRLSAFFDSPTAKDYHLDLLNLYEASVDFLEYIIDPRGVTGNMLAYSTNYILQMMIAAAFTLLKLLSSFFSASVDLEHGKSLFNKTVWAIRSVSVKENDLPSRFGEVLAQFWKSSGAGAKRIHVTSDAGENSLQLKVKCRMSMSLVYDLSWRWREEFQAHGRDNLESKYLKPTFRMCYRSLVHPQTPSRTPRCRSRRMTALRTRSRANRVWRRR